MNLLVVALGGYAVLVGGLYLTQRSLLYPGSWDVAESAQAAALGFQVAAVESDDGLTLSHWYRPAADPAQPVVVVFQGNAGHVGHRAQKFASLQAAGFGLLLVGYRGYGGNPGKPSEAGLTADGRSARDWLAAQGIAPERTILYGESLGSGIAVKLAAEQPLDHPFAALILEATFSSIADVAQSHYWWLPARILLRDKWDCLSRIDRINAPLLIVHGEQDRIVPPKFGRRLFDAAPEPKEALFLPDADHNFLYDFPEVQQRVIAFIRSNS